MPLAEVSKYVEIIRPIFIQIRYKLWGIIHLTKELDIDFLTAAHKFHGPKGIGFLYSNAKTKLVPMIHGGAQEGYREN